MRSLNAMVFAAGLGSRLQPLTQNKPKAMVEINNKPLLWYAINNVMNAGATKIIVNVHHFSEQIINYLHNENFNNTPIIVSDETSELLETGGGLLNAASLFDEDCNIIIHNADVLTNCNLKSLVDQHQSTNALATLMVQDRKTQRYFLFNKEGMLNGWQNLATGEVIPASLHCDTFTPLAFNGIQIVNSAILKLLGPVRKFSITHGYLNLMPHHPIYGWHQWNGQWFDIGTIEKLQQAREQFRF